MLSICCSCRELRWLVSRLVAAVFLECWGFIVINANFWAWLITFFVFLEDIIETIGVVSHFGMPYIDSRFWQSPSEAVTNNFHVYPIGTRFPKQGVGYEKRCHITEYFIFKRINELGKFSLSGDPQFRSIIHPTDIIRLRMWSGDKT